MSSHTPHSALDEIVIRTLKSGLMDKEGNM